MESTQQDQKQQPAPVRPRLERLRSDRAIAGVASGLARYLGIDVAWVRIGFVVSALFGGMGVLLYLIGWLAVPEEGETESIAVDKVGDVRSAGSWIGIGLIVLAGMIVLGNTGLIAGELMFAAVLVAIGVLLYRGDLESPKRSTDVPSSQPDASSMIPTAEPDAAPTETEPIEPPLPSYAIPPPPPVQPPIPDPAFQPRPIAPREPSFVGRFAMASLLIVVGVMGIGQSAGWFDPTLRHYAAAVLVVLGGFLLVSSIFGRARWLIAFGLALSPLLIAMALLTVPFEGGFGDPRHTPTSIAEVNAEYRLVAGQMVLDLTDLEITEGEAVELETSVVFGRLEVILPADVSVNAVAKVDAGEIFIDGVRQSQLDPLSSDNVHMERSVFYEGSGQLVLEAHVGFGELSMRRLAEVTP